MTYMPKDTQARGETGVVISLASTTDGTTRLVFDDVSRQTVMDAIAWNHRALFTTLDLSTPRLERLELSEQELARIGENVVLRLLATTGKRSGGAT